ncbi:MAG: haloacid dehalogenase [Campylobacterota bacterium]|nr:haloacid dehalogenase [Campylobacterota bacterium]
MIEIPNHKDIDIKHIVCDYNGTIAKDGMVLPQIKALFDQLREQYQLYVITADTFGSVHQQLEGYGAEIICLTSDNHTQEKADFITSLGAKESVALGNGNNDTMMLQSASIGIAILGDEGCSKEALLGADILCKEIYEALELFIKPKRLIATLRK